MNRKKNGEMSGHGTSAVGSWPAQYYKLAGGAAAAGGGPGDIHAGKGGLEQQEYADEGIAGLPKAALLTVDDARRRGGDHLYEYGGPWSTGQQHAGSMT